MLDTNLFLQEAVLDLRRCIFQLERAGEERYNYHCVKEDKEVKVCIQRTEGPARGQDVLLLDSFCEEITE